MNNPCPNCGFVGNNPNCRQHVTYWGVNPNLNLVPPPQASINWINSSSAELFAEIGRLNVLLSKREEELKEIKECLRWYVENDDTNEGGKWEESNASWLEGKRRAMRALGMEEE